MGRRSTSSPLVGRDGELADLLAAIRSGDREHPVILVAGEAGIGKTRLLSEVATRLAEGQADGATARTLVARGSCLRLAEGELPFAPILEVLAAIRAWGASAAVGPLYERLAGASPEGPGSPEARTLRFIEIHDALIETAAAGPLVVMIDDLHWADQSTLDLVLFLARRLRSGGVTLVAAYRSDELHRRHPLRPVVAELSRGFVRERIELGPLDRSAVAEHVAALDGALTEGVVEAIADRADGNPFYVEELVALDPRTAGLPPSVRDVLLARLAALDSATAQVLGACAVIGREADAELIHAVVGLDPGTVDAALRTAVDHWILVPDPDGRSYRFRHALLEEAVQDDLLPGDRVDLHRRVAAALRERDGTVPPGELARHLDAGGRAEEAIDAYLRAADVAFRALAWTEGVAAFERAAALDARGGPNGLRPGLRDLVRPAANALNWAGAPSRGVALLRDWIERTEAAGDGAAAAAMWLTLGRILNDVGEEADSRQSLHEAMRLFPADESTALGVDLLVAMSADSWIPGRSGEALRIAERAVAGAELLSDPEVLFRALIHRAVGSVSLGQLDRGIADVERARRLQAEHGWLDTYGILATNVAAALADLGEVNRSLDLLHEGLRLSAELGITRSWDPWNLPGVALAAFLAGRWADADAPIDAARAYEARGMPTIYNEWVAALLAAGRGDLGAADRAIDTAQAEVGDVVGDWHAMLRLARAARADAADDPERRLDELDAAQRMLEGLDAFVFRSRIAAETASAAADAVGRLHPARDRGRIDALRARARAAAERATDIDAGQVVPGSTSVPLTRAYAALAGAEAARAEGRDEPASWPPVADAFAAIGLRPVATYATFRGAAAALAAGDRDAAAARLRSAGAIATSIGMTVLERRIRALGRAGRIELAPAPDRAVAEVADRPEPWGLSAREREVLALVAQGRTNGEIGAALFISTKTASVHVTHILDKLGVSTRTEAALLASRTELLEPEALRAAE